VGSRASRWPGNGTPLTRHHGGTAKAALQAVKDAKARKAHVAAVNRRLDAQAPRKDRLRPKAKGPAKEPRLIERIAEIQLYLCILCGREMDFLAHSNADDAPSFDHVLPKIRGGGNVGNRLAAHRRCNTEKSDNLPNGCELIWLAAVNARLGV
jgi:5-methylcytosine-specific restriction endonuclease McrA